MTSAGHKELASFVVLFFVALLFGCAPARPTDATTSPKAGGTVILALAQEPDTLNPYLASQKAAAEVHTFVIQGLLGVDENGSYFPVLATEVPTKENGGVSADGLTITYHLRQNVRWSSGDMFTCADVQFTWKAVADPKSGAVGTSGYREIESLMCPDDYTAVIRYSSFYAAFLVPFWAVLPRSAGEPATMTKWDYNRAPIGTGPFKIKEWVSGDHITLVRNDNYWEAGKPSLESVIIRFVPSRDVALQLLESNQVTIVGDLLEANLPQLSKVPHISIGEAASPRAERLLLNLADPSIDTPPDPARQPHPILSDPRVRQALELAINKQEIVNRILYGKASVGTNELSTGWARCDTPPSEYNLAQAAQLLDQAGWVPGPDGIRIAHGAQYAKDGTRLRLKLAGPTGDAIREQVEQVLIDWWKRIGVEAYIENAPTASLFGTWDSGSAARRGKFDILIYSTGPYVDPQSQLETYFASWNIPLASNKGSGYNYSRWIDPKADAAIKVAGSTPDISARRAAYCQLMQEVAQERPEIYLYVRNLLAAYRDNLQNWQTNAWRNLGWNSADWYLSDR